MENMTPLVAIIGPRASGKTMLIDSIIAGKHRDVLGLPEGDLFVPNPTAYTQWIKQPRVPTVYHLDTKLTDRWLEPDIAEILRNATKKVILIRTPEQLRANMQDRLSRYTKPKHIKVVRRDLRQYQDSDLIMQHNQRMIEAFPEALIW